MHQIREDLPYEDEVELKRELSILEVWYDIQLFSVNLAAIMLNFLIFIIPTLRCSIDSPRSFFHAIPND